MKSITLKRREGWNSIYQLLSMDTHSDLLEWKHLFKKLSSFFDDSSESDWEVWKACLVFPGYRITSLSLSCFLAETDGKDGYDQRDGEG
jgi:hypothetical protein